jgi:uncharacterized protein (DUF2141 family)
MRNHGFCLTLLFAASIVAFAQAQPSASKGFTLTVRAEDVNKQAGNIGVLLFSADKGWPDDRSVAVRDIVVPAHPGNVTVTIPGLPPGDYAVAILHDANQNHKMDRNWIGKPTEQWGMSNNPHSLMKVPPFSAARFTLQHDLELHVKMQ